MANKYKRDPQLQFRNYYGWKEDYWIFITPTDYMVYSCIAFYADWSSGEARPTFKTIHLDTKICIDSIRNSVRWLESIGVMSIEFRKIRNKQGTPYGRKRYIYTLTHRPNKKYSRKHNDVNKKQVLNLWKSRFNR